MPTNPLPTEFLPVLQPGFSSEEEADDGATLRYNRTTGRVEAKSAFPEVAVVFKVTRTLTSAEILALFTTPITLVAGQAGKVILPVLGSMIQKFDSTAYGTFGGNVVVGWPTQEWGSISDDFLVDSVSRLAAFAPTAPYQALLSAFESEPIRISHSASNPVDGDGTLDVTVVYVVLDA